MSGLRSRQAETPRELVTSDPIGPRKPRLFDLSASAPVRDSRGRYEYRALERRAARALPRGTARGDTRQPRRRPPLRVRPLPLLLVPSLEGLEAAPRPAFTQFDAPGEELRQRWRGRWGDGQRCQDRPHPPAPWCRPIALPGAAGGAHEASAGAPTGSHRLAVDLPGAPSRPSPFAQSHQRTANEGRAGRVRIARSRSGDVRSFRLAIPAIDMFERRHERLADRVTFCSPPPPPCTRVSRSSWSVACRWGPSPTGRCIVSTWRTSANRARKARS